MVPTSASHGVSRAFVWLAAIGVAARVAFFCYGLYQDAHFTLKYTDVDYNVFHDAAGFVYNGGSPYERDTYRYTPLLSWVALINWQCHWFHATKLVFMLADIVTGLLIYLILRRAYPETRCSERRRLVLTALWLLNPMVITISTRGNAEPVLCVLILGAMYCLVRGSHATAGLLLGLAIHVKMYPIVYAGPWAVFILSRSRAPFRTLFTVGCCCAGVLVALTAWMYALYGQQFLDEALLYHVVRLDHRHNFSLWNVLLYFDSAQLGPAPWATRLAFLPQALVTLVGPMVLQYRVKATAQAQFRLLMSVQFVQTVAFVAFNKVCTSQYFIWYLTLLPFYLADTRLRWWAQGCPMLLAWAGTQAIWLYEAYQLEFLGSNVFYPGLFAAAAAFFLANVYIVAQCVQDIAEGPN
ncbi:glycosylphosphatidylinositol-alpha 1,4 mannosyltransferase I KNAG_0M01360 [Huiozyma naganishii CBS 8797]|uniref:GPI mannosyltransferase 1 n=1 Tax=Huiozyma naganishii (strain ATCC MYA-139 / BCRC 22969 / CBS 8797 / KCTC 17520 / NBRC 10181 / NCYC 3082 / Yp74L-3) TaxID=1071383 RepID=J7SAS7_HUIN7|nr:hypothetical protein KNAG_0M01360 [Kazachstania naganishii CBS 8797]CCK72989.1 hypothetical protein KNAG_0M01360 [Kazachstania naganishii CBS 8797]